MAGLPTQVVLQRLIDAGDQVKSVVVVVELADGTYIVDYSETTIRKLAYTGRMLEREINRVIDALERTKNELHLRKGSSPPASGG